MQRVLGLLAIGACAGALVALPAAAQTPPEVTLTRLDCGSDPAPREVGRFSDTFAFPDMKRPFTFSCYVIKHGNEYMVWDTGFVPGSHWTSGGSKSEAVTLDKDVFGDGTVVMLETPGHTPGHHSLMVRLKEKGTVILVGDLAHFHENYDTNGVPSFNTDRAATLASLDRVKKMAANLKATVIIQHDSRDIDKLPAFPAAAR